MAKNYAHDYQQGLQQKFSTGLSFAELYNTPNNQSVKWTGPKTIQIPRITVGGYTDVDRDVVGNYTRRADNDWEPKTIAHDREFKTLVDPQDIDETNMALSIVNITRVFNSEQKFPEMDKYMASKLYSEFTGAGKTANATALTADTVLSTFDDFMMEMDDSEVPQEGRILYVTPQVNKLLKQAKEIQRMLVLNTNNGTANRNIYDLDAVTIKVVPSSRMKTAYNFTNGAVPDVAAKQINMILVHPLSVISPQKYDFVDLDEPTAATAGKYLYYERKYWDVFAIQKKVDGIKFNITTP
ncbi:capsid protein [Bacillus sp. AFS098217]|uniref:capsid protein n=1 Tax=unclassified Bacillus (in: firmicutes) TaxID=185979 RepID=UPI000BEE6FBD|nr:MULTISPECIES: capsid protein [unclassified Bacillus (in: firmicutes)]PEB52452.1 capsid protein [Bacillus sp. AFS098217]PEU16824.1 capsid protein [Bacillus sp. AFS019443]PEU20347.1 capsid protein [Bacillus sp. AFS014408]